MYLAVESAQCFICQEELKDEHLYKCSIVSCDKLYHMNCVEMSYYARASPTKSEVGGFICPRHTCITCAAAELPRAADGDMVTCVRCANAYHKTDLCIPAGSQLLTTDSLICIDHAKLWVPPGDPESHHVSWCWSCGKEGSSLVGCKSCPLACHKRCLDVDVLSWSEGKENKVAKQLDQIDDTLCAWCELGKLPVYGGVVWAKLASFRWWPAVILHPDQMSNSKLKNLVSQSLGHYLVYFFGLGWGMEGEKSEQIVAWANRLCVVHFKQEDSVTALLNMRNRKLRSYFKHALKEAQNAAEAQTERRLISIEDMSDELTNSLIEWRMTYHDELFAGVRADISGITEDDRAMEPNQVPTGEEVESNESVKTEVDSMKAMDLEQTKEQKPDLSGSSDSSFDGF